MIGLSSARRRALVALCAAIAVTAILGGARAQTRNVRRVHVVRAGDTLVAIARRHHVSVEELTRENRLRSDALRLGARLTIPERSTWRRSTGRRHIVRPGETLARVARRFRVSVEDLTAANALRSETIHPGDLLLVPRRGQSGAQLRAETREGNAPQEEPPPLPEEVTSEAEARAAELRLGPTHVGQALLRGQPDPSWMAAVGERESLDGTLLLPVRDGHYLRGWGSGNQGYHLAVDIGAPSGTEILAAERGVVAYAANGIRGYGNFVILVHANGWVTAYAHNRVNLVVPGQIVERGEVIAHVGQTGFARGPHLHFMLTFEGEHCNPVPLFVPRIVRADGEEIDEPEVVWATEHRPSAVRCLPRAQRPHPHYERGHARR